MDPHREVAREADVVIVGAGPVGMTLALLLDRWGVSSLLLDRRSRGEPCDGSRSLCQQRDVLDTWNEVGVAESLVRSGVTWTTARTFFGEEELFALELPQQPTARLPPFVNVSQKVTERRLQERIRRCPRIAGHWDVEVTELCERPGGVEARAVDLDEVEQDPLLFRGRYGVVTAGSAAGALREQLEIGFPGTTFDDRFLICDIQVDLPGWSDERRFWFDPPWNPGRQVLIHPQADSVYRIDWQVPPDFDLGVEENTGALDDRIRAIVGERDFDVLWRSVYRFHSRCADRFRSGGWFLAGDSAHVVAPFGARGLNSGVHDAENLSWKLGFVLSGASHPELLDSYDPERRAAALDNLDITNRTMRFLVPHTETERAHRRDTLAAAAEAALRHRREGTTPDPALFAAIDSGRLYEPFCYHDSPLTTQDPTRSFQVRPKPGELPPLVPGVLLPDLVDREGTPLRSLARRGLLLILGDELGGSVDAFPEPQPEMPFECSTRILGAEIDPKAAELLRLGPDEFCLVRPDAHIAAFGRGSTELIEALRKSLHPRAVE